MKLFGLLISWTIPEMRSPSEASFSLWISSLSISLCFVRSVIRMMAMPVPRHWHGPGRRTPPRSGRIPASRRVRNGRVSPRRWPTGRGRMPPGRSVSMERTRGRRSRSLPVQQRTEESQGRRLSMISVMSSRTMTSGSEMPSNTDRSMLRLSRICRSERLRSVMSRPTA